ncbi:YncE family protein [Falsigemmobacter faecalis]|uniref:ATP-binding protein n=1 Tax=Falsigemmobacter faecalis TaxID=2488730 RepID=A0A3P3DVD0_9RHOB|nr:ATP-binding protein [Falsigemmobacter faecalis]RRH78129.1 ATP-binding protein [Falsigemmobacter faecalis]
MIHPIRSRSLRRWLGASALLVLSAGVPAVAETVFTPTANGFQGTVSAAAPERGGPIVAGGQAVIRGQGLIPGQQITLMRGSHVLNDAPLTADAEGKFSFDLKIDAEAARGLHPIVVIAENPAAASVIDLKVSPDLPLSGAENFIIESAKVAPGLYQVAFGEAAGAIFVTAASGRPPVKDSALYRLDPQSLQIIARGAAGEAPALADGREGGVFAVYGLGLDEANGTIWTTNTRQNTVAIYRQNDLSLVKQFEPGLVDHGRDVVIDQARGRAYISTSVEPKIEVFTTGPNQKIDTITIQSLQRGAKFAVMSLALDAKAGRLYTVSMSTAEYATVNLEDHSVKVFPLPGAKGASGVAFDPEEGLLFVASQQSDNLLIVKAEDGTVLQDAPVGAGALNVTFEPKSRQAFVANRGAGTITVVDTSGEVKAVLDAGSFPNHLQADGQGNVWAVNKSRGAEDEAGDRLWRITPKAQ